VWLIYYKKHTGRPRISYDHAVEEALCFGWIDSIVKQMDDERFAQRFTPRRDWTNWSAINKRRLRTLIREGRMTEAGRAKIDAAILRAEPRATTTNSTDAIPPFVKRALKAHAQAWENFQKLAPSHRKTYIRWISEAKQEATRDRRLQETVSRLTRRPSDPDDIPGFIAQALKANPKAGENFRKLAPSYRRLYIGWITHASKAETRERRLREAISLLEQNKKLGLK
jgi:uncharacterized protein YdeI (YjbR/CyaY-like superfamily)